MGRPPKNKNDNNVPPNVDGGIPLNLDPYVRLAAAVMKAAVGDYITALETHDAESIRELEKFFRSKYGQALSFGNGEEIIQLSRKIAKCDIASQNEKEKLHPSTE